MKHLAAALFLVISAAQAATPVKVCKDSAGRPIIGDTKPTTCTTPSEAERDAMAADAAKAAEELRQIRATEHSNALLLKRYPSEAAVETAREKELRPFRQRLADARENLKAYELARKPIDVELAFHPDGKLPPKWQRIADQNDAQMDAQKAIMSGINQSVAEVNAVYDERLDRVRKLLAKQQASAKPPSGSSR